MSAPLPRLEPLRPWGACLGFSLTCAGYLSALERHAPSELVLSEAVRRLCDLLPPVLAWRVVAPPGASAAELLDRAGVRRA